MDFAEDQGRPVYGGNDARCVIEILWGWGAENAGVENAGVENAGVDSRGGKCRSDNVWKAVKQKIKILNILIKLTIGVKHNRTNWPGSWSRSPTL